MWWKQSLNLLIIPHFNYFADSGFWGIRSKSHRTGQQQPIKQKKGLQKSAVKYGKTSKSPYFQEPFNTYMPEKTIKYNNIHKKEHKRRHSLQELVMRCVSNWELKSTSMRSADWKPWSEHLNTSPSDQSTGGHTYIHYSSICFPR